MSSKKKPSAWQRGFEKGNQDDWVARFVAAPILYIVLFLLALPFLVLFGLVAAFSFGGKAAFSTKGRPWAASSAILLAPWLASPLLVWAADEGVRSLVMTITLVAATTWDGWLLWKAKEESWTAKRRIVLESVIAVVTIAVAVTAALLPQMGGLTYPLVMMLALIPLTVRVFCRLRSPREAAVVVSDESPDEREKRQQAEAILELLFDEPRVRDVITPDKRYLREHTDKSGEVVVYQDWTTQRQDFESRVRVEWHKRDGLGALNRFDLVLSTSGHTLKEFENLAAFVLTTCDLHEAKLRPQRGGAGTARIYCVSGEPHDFTRDLLSTAFLDANPPKDSANVVIAKSKYGDPVMMPIGHFLCVGATGAGKGSFGQTVLYTCRNLVKSGDIVFYGLDPKASEFSPYVGTTMFRRIGTDTKTMADVVLEVHDEFVAYREAQVGQVNRDWNPSKAPRRILMIDEFPSVMKAFREDKRTDALNALSVIMTQGRSSGFHAIFMSQFATKKHLEDLRDNIMGTLMLRTQEAYTATAIWGDRAVNAPAHRIPRPSKAFQSAGTGFMDWVDAPAFEEYMEDLSIVSVRIPYITDDDLRRLVEEMTPAGGTSLVAAAPAPLPELDESGVYVTDF